MCTICTNNPTKSDHFECPTDIEWPNDPLTPEQQTNEVHDWAIFKRENPERAKALTDEFADRQEKCNHLNHHMMVQTWQNVDVLVKVCDSCGATILATESY